MLTEEGQRRAVVEAYGNLPLTFVRNQGKTNPQVQFQSQRPGCGISFTPTHAEFVFTRKTVSGKREHLSLAMQFLDANPGVVVDGLQEDTGKVHYYYGNDPQKWCVNLSTYREVLYQNLWPSIDLIFYGREGRIKYDFVLRPGADVETIQLAYDGAEELSLDEAGNLLIHTAMGVISEEKPTSYQEIDGQRVPVDSRFVIRRTNGKHGYSFWIGDDYNPDYPLVIDPILLYSTFLGASAISVGSSIAIDTEGHAYVTGYTSAPNFPVTIRAYQTGNAGNEDVFIAKLNAAGTALIYATYLGGADADVGNDIKVDASGNAYVTGYTFSADFPTTRKAYQTRLGGVSDAFVTKLNPTGSALIYSTYLGGSLSDFGNGIAIDHAGNAYVAGDTLSANFPTTRGAFQTTWSGSDDAFVSKLNAAGTALIYSTYLGGSSDDAATSIAVDAKGNAYVTGFTFSANFPTTSGAFQTALAGDDDVFVTKLDATGAKLVYSTFLGGVAGDQAFGIALDRFDNAYVAGRTTSTDFPTTTGAFQPVFAGVVDVFVSKFDTMGTLLVYSTFLGGSGDDEGRAIAVDTAGNAYVTGYTMSSDFPVTAGAFQNSLAGLSDAFVTVVNTVGNALVYSTYLGGQSDDAGYGIVSDAAFNFYVAGLTFSTQFPTTPGALQTSLTGEEAAFVSKFGIPGQQLPCPPRPCKPCVHQAIDQVDDALEELKKAKQNVSCKKGKKAKKDVQKAITDLQKALLFLRCEEKEGGGCK